MSLTMKLGDRARLAASIACAPTKLAGLPLSYHPSFEVEVSRFGPAELRKALADSEIITSLLREHPKEIAAIVNHALAGDIHAANTLAVEIGLTEGAFQKGGGGCLFEAVVVIVFVAILTYAALGDGPAKK